MSSLRFSISHGVVKCSSVSCRPQIMVSRPSTTTNAAAVRTCKMKHIQQQRLVQMRSTDVSNPTGAPEGEMSQEIITAMEAKIADALEAQQVSVTDVYGDGRHVNISVVSAAFEGKNSVQRQRMVYKAIWLELQDAVHAVDSMTTKTPAEAA